jgi:signal-transduction protein with cAMP-binding, CBS, and nucleotidyltransferase domain
VHVIDFERLTLADALDSRTYHSGEVIIQEGDEGETFFIIETGQVKCTKQGITGEVCPRLRKGKDDLSSSYHLLIYLKHVSRCHSC